MKEPTHDDDGHGLAKAWDDVSAKFVPEKVRDARCEDFEQMHVLDLVRMG